MKKLIVIGIAAVMVMGLVGAANAAFDPSWLVNLKVSTSADGSAQAFTLICATNTTVAITAAPPPGVQPMVYAYSTSGTTSLIKDQRVSFAGTTMQWVIKLGGVNFANGINPESVYLFGWNPNDGAIVKTNQFVATGGETLALYASPDGIVKGAKLWDVVKGGTGASTDALTWKAGGMAVPLNSMFILEETLVPEPGSILALASGLIGLIGFGTRRRK